MAWLAAVHCELDLHVGHAIWHNAVGLVVAGTSMLRGKPGEILFECGDLAFQNVSFRYKPSGPPVLDGLSFAVAPRECAAIVGRSGVGKSTVVNLLLGAYAPDRRALRRAKCERQQRLQGASTD